MFYKNIVGQDKIKQILTDALSAGRIAHAQMFIGKEGSGNLNLAIAYAQNILCATPQNGMACGSCSSCIKSEKLIHPDLHFIYPVNTNQEVKKNAKSDDFLPLWREHILNKPFTTYSDWLKTLNIGNKQASINKQEVDTIIEKLSLKSYESEYKVVVMWLPEKIGHAAAPKLLKTLEEPTDKTIFLLASEHTDTILPTIMSRVQSIKLAPIAKEEIATAFSNNERFAHLSSEAIQTAAKKSEGSISKAIELLGDVEDEFQSDFLTWMRLCFSIHKNNNAAKVLGWVEGFAKQPKEYQKSFFTKALDIFRQCNYINYKTQNLVSLSDEENKVYEKFAPYISSVNITSFMEHFDKNHYYVERNANAKILMFDLSFKIAKFIRLKDA